VLRLIGVLVTLAVGVGGLGFVDYTNWRSKAVEEGRVGLSVQDYLNDLPQRLPRNTAPPTTEPSLPTDLVDMMPLAPQGWTLRPAVFEDAAAFLPRNGGNLSRGDQRRIESLMLEGRADGPETVALTYERGERRVVIRAERFPDSDFTGPLSQHRIDLRLQAASVNALPVMTVRGLDVSEAPLPNGMRARMFVAAVGTQIQLTVLASDRLEDQDLLPFFETLNVKAMNASVVEKVEGLGDLPVIALSAAMPEAQREAFKADRAAKKARLAVTAALSGEEAAAVGEVTPETGVPKVGQGADCVTDANGIKRCTVGGN
jgi:hypothetical protein